jgi:hypothetical protein
MLDHLQRWSKLNLPMMLACFVRLSRVRVLLALKGFEKTVQHLQLNQAIASNMSQAQPELWRERALYFKRAARLVPGAKCLARSLALCHWARKHQQAAEFFIGAQIVAGKSSAHSWIQIGDEVIDDSAVAIEKFTVIFRC